MATHVRYSMYNLHQASRRGWVIQNQFSYFLTKTYVVGTRKNPLNPKHVLKLRDKKILTILLSKSYVHLRGCLGPHMRPKR